MKQSAESRGDGPLAIFCAGGNLPFEVADAARRTGRQVFLYALRGFADATKVQDYPHQWGSLGQFGRFYRFARNRGCKDVVFIGTLTRPSFWRVWPDLKALRLLPRMLAAFRGGDNHLLSAIARMVEEHGFRMLGAHEIAPEILMQEGPIGRATACERDSVDIACGLALLRSIGAFDVGQAVVVADSRVLAVEAAEGTDRMLAHLTDLRRSGAVKWPTGTGVLVKAPKAGQDRRIDLPSIGPRTVEMAHMAGLAGVAVVARETVIAEPQAVAEIADRTNLFVIGVAAGEAG
jgi:DUF1009 family protein